MGTSYDTLNLRKEASYTTTVFPSIEWVPYSSVGITKFSKDNIMEIIHSKEKESLKHYISCPYEIIQYLQHSDFAEVNDHSFSYSNGNKWEHHKSGLDALRANQGSCSSIAGIIPYFLEGHYENVGSLCILSSSGNGHALNYLQLNGYFYIMDLFVQMNSYARHIPIETGKKVDFVRTKYITGGCLRTHSLHCFLLFFEKYNKKAYKQFLYYTYPTEICPSVSMHKDNGNLRVLLPDGIGIEVINGSSVPDKIICEFEGMSDTTWG
jgi:hypothetical protein